MPYIPTLLAHYHQRLVHHRYCDVVCDVAQHLDHPTNIQGTVFTVHLQLELQKKESTSTNTFSSLLSEELYINMSSQEWEAKIVFILCGSTH